MPPSSPPHLELPPPDEYGCRPAVSQERLTEYLLACGMLPVQRVAAPAPKSLQYLRDEASHIGTPSMLVVRGRELPEFLPASIGDAYVWYFALPQRMAPRVRGLLPVRLWCYGSFTGDPWENAVFLGVSTGERVAANSIHYIRDLSFRADAVDLSGAAAQGFVVTVFDCAGALHTHGTPVGDELLQDLSSCGCSSFQRPLRCYSLQRLQERTRAVEETGRDPEGQPSEGNLVLPVMCSPSAQRQAHELPDHIRRRLPALSWFSMPSAAIGWLGNLTNFPEEAAAASPLVLKVTVASDVFALIQEARYTLEVHELPPHDHVCGPIYLVVVMADAALCAVAMAADDWRFRGTYGYWARHGSFTVAFENLRNGRLCTAKHVWPVGAAAETSLAVPSDIPPPPSRLHDHSAVRSCLEALAADMPGRVVCYCSDVHDEETWKQQATE